MLVVQNKQTPSIYTHVNSTQRVNAYYKRDIKGYVPRFYVYNYKPKDKQYTQRSFKSFKKQGDALAWVEQVCSRLDKYSAGDVFAIERIVKELNNEAKQCK